MSAVPESESETRRSRGDRQRDAIVAAVRELLGTKPFADLSVSMISERAGVARSGFYFYFDSKYDVLAYIVKDALTELDALTHNFAPRDPGESPAAFAKRMVGSAAAVFTTNDPVMAACTAARNTDAQINDIMNDFEDLVIAKIVAVVEEEVRNGTRPISDDIPALVRMLTATSAWTLSQDAGFVGRNTDPQRAVDVLERLWLHALWGTAASWEG
ncbi:TetR/AcrR family transcriptional regulator [Mycolicibacterium diernhoferi]|uniref:TetR family transcriptional regulator n=1 Tax=Mycolicibacterium diernhoferi TaxID=1801 RepID=A0A1Q4HFU8_9MYCO|nr:TetR/AcrR family transcriptional regulator [Mycolicibacterium diernhoferi]OJZ66387.1 TetR family transcriptional regulator [Mycolicibacterium diernhoferi]OPE52263.1 TetR family transcriptional regulator [Mycolicibacterium diernhoferi]PEG54186.1 TetR/AcrR family transcriptional regulator [Mycolicibacterium diernhoferi]QYL24557.1 TetR/AcrR family transcriptional regulator [Mycolicibacterium diernhoferi]